MNTGSYEPISRPAPPSAGQGVSWEEAGPGLDSCHPPPPPWSESHGGNFSTRLFTEHHKHLRVAFCQSLSPPLPLTGRVALPGC